MNCFLLRAPFKNKLSKCTYEHVVYMLKDTPKDQLVHGRGGLQKVNSQNIADIWQYNPELKIVGFKIIYVFLQFIYRSQLVLRTTLVYNKYKTRSLKIIANHH